MAPRRTRLIAGAVTAAALVAITALALGVFGGDEPEAKGPSLNFATVRRTDIVSVRTFDGQVATRGEGPRILGRLSGTVTDIAAVGSKVERGHALYSVNGSPVFLFYGSLPAWRDIGPDVSDDRDVTQLEENLKALRFNPGPVDKKFTSATESAVRAWQESVGFPQTGRVGLGRVVFAPAALTVEEQLKTVGAPVADGDEIMSALSSQKVVTVGLNDESDLVAGDVVDIVLTGRKVPARVISVDTPDTEGTVRVGAATVATVVSDEAGALAGHKDGADADIELFEESHKNVLAVPITALIARKGGGYAVEVDRGAGRTELVTVTPGLYSAELAEVRGDLKEGDRVVVP